MSEVGTAWIFDPVPSSGARSGGDPSAFVFEASTAAFVREVLQNSIDQAVGDAVTVRFDLQVVDGDHRDTRDRALGWDALLAHVRGVVDAGGQTEQQRFGARERARSGQRAVSVWGDAAKDLADAAGVPLPERGSGTILLIPGFEDPAADGEPDPTALAAELQRAAERDFWPAMVDARLIVSTRVDGAALPILVDSSPWQDMLYAYRDHAEVDDLAEPGQIAVHPIAITLPPRAGHKGGTEVHADSRPSRRCCG